MLYIYACINTYIHHGRVPLGTGVKGFECITGHKIFSQDSHLNRRELTHTLVKDLNCINYQKTISLASNLKTHELSHSGVKDSSIRNSLRLVI